MEQPDNVNVEYFRKEILKFRKLMGKKSFWADPDLPGNAMKGLLYVYIHTDGLTTKEASFMRTTVKEFDMRLGYMVALKLKGIL